ncbi:unnamed protein product [Xylocopa violacea]|uniref:Uncharacterized protein n=1 Tax=Xylocopa violacea TaxID=135666 RepID=A0ABP1NW59_XYLVO
MHHYYTQEDIDRVEYLMSGNPRSYPARSPGVASTPTVTRYVGSRHPLDTRLMNRGNERKGSGKNELDFLCRNSRIFGGEEIVASVR